MYTPQRRVTRKGASHFAFPQHREGGVAFLVEGAGLGWGRAAVWSILALLGACLGNPREVRNNRLHLRGEATLGSLPFTQKMRHFR